MIGLPEFQINYEATKKKQAPPKIRLTNQFRRKNNQMSSSIGVTCRIPLKWYFTGSDNREHCWVTIPKCTLKHELQPGRDHCDCPVAPIGRFSLSDPLDIFLGPVRHFHKSVTVTIRVTQALVSHRGDSSVLLNNQRARRHQPANLWRTKGPTANAAAAFFHNSRKEVNWIYKQP